MLNVPSKAPVLVALALLGGLGAAYTPVPTFAAVATVFGLGLWLLLREEDRLPPEPGMDEGAGQAGESRRSALIGKLVQAYLLVWWLILIAPLAAYSPREVGAGAAQAAASGSLKNQILVASFGIVGFLFLPAAVKRVDRAFWWLVALWALYLAWAYTSLFWSVYPALTLRNLAAYVLVSIGSFGLGAGFYGNHPNGRGLFLKHVIAAGFLSALVVLIPLPFYLGEFNPLDPAQRLEISGDLATFAARPVMVAALALIAASMLGLRRWRTRDWLGILVLLLPILVLKTRGPLLWAMLALGIVYLLCRNHDRDRVLQAGLLFIAGLGVYVLHFSGVLASLVPYLTRDNVDLSLSLTGRVPLWDALIPAVEQRPLLGAGFAAFWNPDNLYFMERLVGFPVVSAHNGFLEELLNTGAVGLALFLTFWVSTMVVALARTRRGDALGWMAFLFLLFYLFLNLTSSLMQEYLEIPFMIVFVIMGLMATTGPAPERPSEARTPGAAVEKTSPALAR